MVGGLFVHVTRQTWTTSKPSDVNMSLGLVLGT